jgi:hypothetical protein
MTASSGAAGRRHAAGFHSLDVVIREADRSMFNTPNAVAAQAFPIRLWGECGAGVGSGARIWQR